MLVRSVTRKLPVTRGPRVVVVDDGEDNDEEKDEENRKVRRRERGMEICKGEEGRADVYFNDWDWWKSRSDKKETSVVYTKKHLYLSQGL